MNQTQSCSYSAPEDSLLFQQLASLQSDTELCDFVITCGQEVWNVHRVVLCLHSRVLTKWCKGDFKEAKECKIDLSDEHPACVEGMIHYLYRIKYPDPSKIKKFSRAALLYHIQMYVLADKYEILPLKRLAAAFFERDAAKQWNTSDFVEAAAEAFGLSGAVKEICDTIARLAVQHRLLRSAEEDQKGFRNVAKGCPEMLMAIIEAMQARFPLGLRARAEEVRFECPSCGLSFICAKPDEAINCFSCGESGEVDDFEVVEE